ncbi:enoyl-CoA hydratase [Corynebacterium sp. S7]
MTTSIRHVEISVESEIATVTLINAKTMNILNTSAMNQLIDSFQQLGSRRDVRVIILRGSGDKAFLGGADINEMVNLNEESARDFMSTLLEVGETIRSVPQPVIARMSGWTLGGGTEVAVACDFRIASSDAKIGMPEVAVGIPSVLQSALIPRLIGRGRATQLLMIPDPIDATTALEWGLINAQVEAEELDLTITQWSERLKSIGSQVLAQQKELMNNWENQPLSSAMEDSIGYFCDAYSTGEPQRLMEDFVNRKR